MKRWLPAAVLLAFVAANWGWLLLDVERLVPLAREDAAIERAGALALLFAAGLLLSAGLRERGAHAWRARPALYGGLALLLLVAAGEELSWGQRFVGWATPETLASGNVQGETNLHNFARFDCHHYSCAGFIIQRDPAGRWVLDLTSLFPLFVLTLTLGVPLGCRVSRRARSALGRLGLVPPPLWLGAIAGASWLASFAGYTRYPPASGHNWAVRELFELHLELVLALLALSVWVRAGSAAEGAQRRRWALPWRPGDVL